MRDDAPDERINLTNQGLNAGAGFERSVALVCRLRATQLVLAAPPLASLLCLVAVVPAAFVQLPLFVSELHELYWGPPFQPAQPTLGEVLAPLLAWLLAAALLVCAAILAWRQAQTSSSE